MSRVLRRKHVLKEMMEDDFELPTEKQQIVRVVSSRGNNLHEVETATADEEHFLASMPNKFRKTVWVKRGNYVLVEPIEEGDKVKAEICKILSAEHVKEYIKAGIWPKQFSKKREHEEVDVDSDEEANGDLFLMRNRNRPALAEVDSDEEDDNSTSDEE
ncbi:PREDICTED: probable RNA-binding protein EIF1AD [Rhagoletis zephyria]|uniref:probable RNA-binding protein EIF1AD n=1 Tax=Rhagoletis zephyria TaxID=28612 RepID=UPI00081176FF|nr:PREDICTED: probable RNA-binding protein EIF1AD [Rhagoletis zephyria]